MERQVRACLGMEIEVREHVLTLNRAGVAGIPHFMYGMSIETKWI